jgi:hypothetical protein
MKSHGLTAPLLRPGERLNCISVCKVSCHVLWMLLEGENTIYAKTTWMVLDMPLLTVAQVLTLDYANGSRVSEATQAFRS